MNGLDNNNINKNINKWQIFVYYLNDLKYFVYI